MGLISWLTKLFEGWDFDRDFRSRSDYYRNVYLKSDEWKRKRYVVLKRDGWKCVYCGARATQVHHKQYAKKNIGKEPTKWLVSICKSCHESKHRYKPTPKPKK
jgi:5-methylcytosine-specific restriction endonuclease McrA